MQQHIHQVVSTWIESAKLVVQAITQDHEGTKHSAFGIYRKGPWLEKTNSVIEAPYMWVLDNAVQIVVVKRMIKSRAIDCGQRQK